MVRFLAMGVVVLLVFTGLAGAQNLANPQVRAADRPTITSAKVEGKRLVFRFVAPRGPYRFYQVRWSRRGKGEDQVQIPCGFGEAHFVIPETPRRNTSYTFKVQAGFKSGGLFSKSICTPWAVRRFQLPR